MPQILVISSTKKHVNDPVYVYDGAGEWETRYGVSLTLNLTAPATVRLTVSSKQNATVTLVKDFGYVSYPAGNSVLNVGNVLGLVGVNLQFLDVPTFDRSLIEGTINASNRSDGNTSTYSINQAYATVYLNTSDAPGSPSAPFATLADVVAAYPVAPSYAVEVEVGTPLNHVTYRYQGPGVGAGAWRLAQSASANSTTGLLWRSAKELPANNSWFSVCEHTPTGRLVAVSDSGTGNQVMVSGVQL